MKFLQFLFIFAVVEVTLQQASRCYECTNCGAIDRSQWRRVLCESGDEDDNIGAPTTPGSPIGFSAKNISIDATIEAPLNATNATVTPIIETMRIDFQCFAIVVDVFGSQLTNRGCVTRRQDVQTTCNSITNQRIIDCQLCNDRDFCNTSGSGQLVYSLFLVAAFYAIWNIMS